MAPVDTVRLTAAVPAPGDGSEPGGVAGPAATRGVVARYGSTHRNRERRHGISPRLSRKYAR